MQSFTRRPLPTHESQIPIGGGIRGMKRKKSRLRRKKNAPIACRTGTCM